MYTRLMILARVLLWIVCYLGVGCLTAFVDCVRSSYIDDNSIMVDIAAWPVCWGVVLVSFLCDLIKRITDFFISTENKFQGPARRGPYQN